MKQSTVLIALVVSVSATACSKKTQDTSASSASASSSMTTDSAISASQRGQSPSAPSRSVATNEAYQIKVYKDPNCGCCKAWIQHLEQNGFVVEVMDMPDLSAVKTKHGVKDEIQACHTGVVNGYAIEGHVPADVILRMLKEKPAIAGLAVPGMPAGSPGMEGAIKEKYDVLTFDRAGRTTVYAAR